MIPLTITAGTAEASDYGGLATSRITISGTGSGTTGTVTIPTFEDDSEYDNETFTVAIHENGLPATVAAGIPKEVLVTITDDDTRPIPTITLTASPNPVTEGESVTITATISEDPTADVMIPLTITAGTAEASDYGGLATSRITISGTGSGTTGTVTIPTFEDDSEYDNETFTVAIHENGLPATVAAGIPKEVLVTITDDDTRPIPTITLTASPNPVTEGESVTITATISEDPTADVMIPLTITAGTAEASDYGGLATGRITISGTGSGTTGTVTIPTFEDDSEYDNETFTVAIHENGLPATVAAGIPKEVLVTITDDDTRPIPTITLTASPNPVTEGESVTITATISEDPTADVMIPLTITAGTAEASDYGGLATSRITISGTGSGTTGTVTIPTFEDDSEYDNETFTVAIHENGLPATVAAGIPKEVLVTITDDDTRPIPTITLTASPNPVTEGESVTITATISEDPTADVMVPLTITAGTAEASDYGGLATSRITISGTGSGTTGTVTIPTFEDDSEYDNETFTVAIHENGLPATVAAGIPKEVLVTITDDDTRPIPTITLTASPNPVTEGESVTITATISEDPTADVMIPLTITAGTAEASDYGGLATGRITISGTGSGTTGTVTIPTFEDDSEYDNETFTVAIHENGLPATVAAGIPKEVLVTITDDDTRPIPTITLTASPNPVTEGESVTITATISEDPTADVMIPLTITAGTAEASDYGGLATGRITISGTGSGTTGTVTIPTFEDDSEYDNETFTVAIHENGLPATVAAGIPKEVLVTITDDDTRPIPTITLTASPNPVTEGESVTITATISEDPTADVMVPLTITAGTAEASDYGGLATSRITISGTGSGTTGTVTIPTFEDDSEYDNETFTVAIHENGLPATVAAGIPKEVLVTITDDDTRPIPTITLTASPNPVTEGESVTITATISEDPTADVMVPLTITAGTAEASDYGGLATSRITISGTGSGTTGTVTIPTFEDDSEYDNETFTVAIHENGLPATVAAGIPKEVLVTITDDDTRPIPTITLTASPNPVTEGESVTITATISEDPTADVMIPLTITAGTAEASDYGGLATSRITISGTGSGTTGTVTIPTFEDDSEYDNETFTVAIHENGLPATVAAGIPKEVLVTITDDDTRPIPTITLTASPNPVTEGESVTITATISEDPTADVMVPLTITAGTAEASDYGGLATSRITISGTGSGTTGTVTIPTFEDDSEYDNETFTVAIHENGLPATVAAGIPKEVLVTITDDDTRPIPTITLTASPNPVTEGESVTITATISEDPTADVMIPLTITAGTAEASDYGGLATGRITISGTGSGTTGTVTIPTFEDDSEYDNETFTVAIHENGLPATVAAGIPKEVLVTITDDDTRPIPTITLTASPNPVTEGESVTITATISEDPTADVMIPLTITAGTAEASDYGGLATGRITISGTGSGTTGTVTIPTFEDDSEYDNETFTVAIHENGLPATVAAGIPKEVLVTITDDDTRPIPTITLTASPNPVTEGESVTITATISEDPTADVMVPLTITAGTAEASDYGGLATSRITISGTGSGTTGTVTIPTFEDDSEYDNETFTVAIHENGLPATVAAGIPKEVLVTITDDDTRPIPTITLTASPNPVTEGESVTITATISEDPTADVMVPLTITAGTAEASDYGGLATSRITISGTGSGTTGTVTIPTFEDDSEYDNETFTVAIHENGLPATVAAGIPKEVLVTITDDDTRPIPTITLTASPNPVTEGESVTITATISEDPTADVMIPLTITAGTAEASDYGGLATSRITISGTGSGTTGTVTIPTFEDDSEYDNETFTVAIHENGLPATVAAGIPKEVEVTIIDNDKESPLEISIYNAQASEDTGNLQLPVTLNRSTDQVVTVHYRSSDVEAKAGLDYQASRGIVIFDPGATSGVIEITIINDDILEGNERFEITLSNARNATIAHERGTGTGTILDDDSNAKIRVDDTLVMEEDGVVQFRVTLSPPQSQIVSVAYRTQDGTAKAGEDYEATSGVVTLAPGITEAIIDVPLLKDGLDWQEETFTIHLESSEHAEIGKAVGVATIQESTTVGEGVMEAYVARFVRTSSSQIVEALDERLRSGTDGAFCGIVQRAEMAQLWYSNWNPSLGELLAGCRVSQSMPVSGGAFRMWGQSAFRQFNGQEEDALALRGEVTTGMLGVDYGWRKMGGGELGGWDIVSPQPGRWIV